VLAIENITTGYGNSQVLFGMSLEIPKGAVSTLLGRNGMGKTTTVNTIIGNLPCHSGAITYNGETLNGLPPYRIAQKGIGLVPEGRQIFPNLNVRENLIATAANYNATGNPWTLERVLDFFPLLQRRLNNMGNQLSGGEQQMLAIGRALMLNPSLLILDEATEDSPLWYARKYGNALGKSRKPESPSCSSIKTWTTSVESRISITSLKRARSCGPVIRNHCLTTVPFQKDTSGFSPGRRQHDLPKTIQCGGRLH